MANCWSFDIWAIGILKFPFFSWHFSFCVNKVIFDIILQLVSFNELVKKTKQTEKVSSLLLDKMLPKNTSDHKLYSNRKCLTLWLLMMTITAYHFLFVLFCFVLFFLSLCETAKCLDFGQGIFFLTPLKSNQNAHFLHNHATLFFTKCPLLGMPPISSRALSEVEGLFENYEKKRLEVSEKLVWICQNLRRISPMPQPSVNPRYMPDANKTV